MANRQTFEFDGKAPEAVALDITALRNAIRVGRPISIRNATIGEDLRVSFADLAEMVFDNCVFEGDLTAGHCKLRGAVSLTKSRFKGSVRFANSTIEGNLALRDVTAELVDFSQTVVDDVVVEGACDFEGISMAGGSVGGSLKLEGATVRKFVDFGSVRVEQSAVFDKCHLRGVASFARARFDGILQFKDLDFEGDVFLFENVAVAGRMACTGSFDAEVIFTGSTFGADFLLSGATFKKHVKFSNIKVARDFDARGAKFLGSAGQRATARYTNGENSFSHATFCGAARFEECEFADVTYFNWNRFLGLTSFGLGPPQLVEQVGVEKKGSGPAVFRGKVDFASSEFGAQVQFGGTTFGGPASFSHSVFHESVYFVGAFAQGADFQSARFESNVSFGCEFLGLTRMNGARFEALNFAYGCRIRGPLELKFASARWVRFIEDLALLEFVGEIDLRGFTYETLDVAQASIAELWTLMKRKLRQQTFASLTRMPLPAYAPIPYKFNRQPYLQFWKVARASGYRALANDVLFEMNAVEGDALKPWKAPLHWGVDRVYRYLAGYGAKLRYVSTAILLSLALAFLVFSRPGAVVSRPNVPLPMELEHLKGIDDRVDLGASGEALAFAVRVFLPFDVPAARYWDPSERRFAGLSFASWASLLKTFGWILFPLLASELIGKAVLRRRDD